MFIRVVLSVILTTVLSLNVSAASWSGSNTIGIVVLKKGGETMVYPQSGNWNLGAESCSGNSLAVITTGKNGNFEQMYKTILIAKYGNADIDLQFDGCINIGSTSYPVIADIKLY